MMMVPMKILMRMVDAARVWGLYLPGRPRPWGFALKRGEQGDKYQGAEDKGSERGQRV
jgi:hypothetical protein